MKQLDPRAFWLFFIQGIFRFIVLIPLFFFWIFIRITDSGYFDFSSYTVLGLVILVLLLLLIIVYANLALRFYKYELTENGFRKESGIIWKKYTTIPYERIQNVDIYRGVFARLLGLSDLNIQTAGMSSGAAAAYGGAYGAVAEGRLPGLSMHDAELLRDELISRARHSKSQGV